MNTAKRDTVQLQITRPGLCIIFYICIHVLNMVISVIVVDKKHFVLLATLSSIQLEIC